MKRRLKTVLNRNAVKVNIEALLKLTVASLAKQYKDVESKETTNGYFRCEKL